MEYYYTNNWIMAGLALEHGFEGIQVPRETYSDDHETVLSVEWEDVGQVLWNYESAWRFPKTPHNVLLMDAQVGDIGLTNGIVLGEICEYHRYDNPPALVSQIDLLVSEGVASLRKGVSENFRIIYRNNRPFPVWDKEGE